MITRGRKQWLLGALFTAVFAWAAWKIARSLLVIQRGPEVNEQPQRARASVVVQPLNSMMYREPAVATRPQRRTTPVPGKTATPRARAGAWITPEKLLLAVEVGAILLFVVAGASLWQTRRQLNNTFRTLQETDPRLLPTLVAAANPGMVAHASQAATQSTGPRPAPILPTPFPTVAPSFVGEDAQRNIAPDEGEQPLASPTPEESASLVAASIMQKRAPENDQARRLTIPAINVDSFIYQNYGEDWLKLGVVQVAEPVKPGQPGNLVLAAHNDVYGEIFRDLDLLRPGDELLVSGDSQTYVYRVRDTIIVEPDDIWVTLPTSTPTITLVSCYPYLLGTQRIVVFGDLIP